MNLELSWSAREAGELKDINLDRLLQSAFGPVCTRRTAWYNDSPRQLTITCSKKLKRKQVAAIVSVMRRLVRHLEQQFFLLKRRVEFSIRFVSGGTDLTLIGGK